MLFRGTFIINLNYMNPNNSLSYEESNEFMPSMPKNNSGPSFQNFMQACFTNPSFFQSMRNYYVAQTHKPAESLSASYQGLNVQPYQQSQPNLSNQPRYQTKVEEDSRSQHLEREVEVSRANQMKRKPANPLTKYFTNQSTNSERANQPLAKPTNPPPPKPSFQDKPIKSNYTMALNKNSQAFDFNTIKENQSINIENPKKKVKSFDDEPIRGVKEYQLESYYKQTEEKTKSAVTSYEDERPIKGLAKDFKEAVRQQFANPMEKEQEYNKEEESEASKPEPRAFLKRGSRQHLSSAMNKSKQPRHNLDNSLNKSGIQQQRDRPITPKRTQPQARTISQNKVLAKKNTNNQQEKSTSKLPNKKNDLSDEQIYSNKSKPYFNKERPPRPEQKGSKASQKPQIKEMQTKNIKRKNVFNDDSSSSSSSEQEVSPTFKPKANVQKNNQKNIDFQDNYNKIEVIAGVYLTQQQLDMIISMYGKVKEVPQESESEKVAALRRKYNEMIALKDEEVQKYKQEIEKEKEQFQKYKAEQLTKLKNERRIMERQVKGGLSSQNLQKDKEELQNLKQQLEKEKEDSKRRDKNNKIIIEKYKKENEELRSKVDRLESELTTTRKQTTSVRIQDNYLQQKAVSSKSINGNVKAKKVEEEIKSQEVSYKDIKKTNKNPAQQAKETKSKYEYVEEDTFSKNKSFSSKQEKKEPKVQNKWASHKFTNSDESASENEDQYQEKVSESTRVNNEWSPAMKLSDLTKTNLSIKMVTDQMIDSLFRYEKNIEYLRYLQSTKLPTRTVVNTTRNNANSYTTKIYSDRTKELVYDNGTRKVSCQNGYSIVYFKNGDIKQTLPDKTVLYYFREKEVDQITLSNGVNIYRFENNQVEFHFQNGYIEIRHPDGTIKVLGEHVRR